jgi:hypothetical protein
MTDNSKPTPIQAAIIDATVAEAIRVIFEATDLMPSGLTGDELVALVNEIMGEEEDGIVGE